MYFLVKLFIILTIFAMFLKINQVLHLWTSALLRKKGLTYEWNFCVIILTLLADPFIASRN